MKGWGLTGQEREFLKLGPKEEGFPLIRWSKVAFDGGAGGLVVTGQSEFFRDTMGTGGVTKWQTNMRETAKLEIPYRAVFKRMWLRFFDDAGRLIGVGTEGVQETITAFRNGWFFETGIIAKEYTEYPADMIPEGGGMIVSYGTNTIAGGETALSQNGGVAAFDNYAPVSIMLEQQVGFRITAQSLKVGGITVPAGVKIWADVRIGGPAVRAEQ